VNLTPTSIIQQGETEESDGASGRDAYTEEEQAVGFLTMMEDHLALPFSTNVLGVDVVVEKVDMTRDGQIVAICRYGNTRQGIGILDLPLPTPARGRAEWIAAYRHWRRGILSERIPVLRFSGNRPRADKS
jgi:hypothetical protein